MSDDQAWVGLFQQGDEAAFEQLVRQWEKPMLNFFYRSLGDLDVAEDLRQDLFVRLYTYRAGYRGDGTFRAWLYQLATNLLRTYLGRTKTFVPLDRDGTGHEEDSLDAPDDSQPVGEVVQRRESARLVREMLGGLSVEDREALILRFYEGLRYGEICQVLDIAETSAKSRVYRAIERLRRMVVERSEKEPAVSYNEFFTHGEHGGLGGATSWVLKVKKGDLASDPDELRKRARLRTMEREVEGRAMPDAEREQVVQLLGETYVEAVRDYTTAVRPYTARAASFDKAKVERLKSVLFEVLAQYGRRMEALSDNERIVMVVCHSGEGSLLLARLGAVSVTPKTDVPMVRPETGRGTRQVEQTFGIALPVRGFKGRPQGSVLTISVGRKDLVDDPKDLAERAKINAYCH